MSDLKKKYRILVNRKTGKVAFSGKFGGSVTSYNDDIYDGFEYKTKTGYENKLTEINKAHASSFDELRTTQGKEE